MFVAPRRRTAFLALLLVTALAAGGAVAQSALGTATVAFDDTTGQVIDVVGGAYGTWAITYTAGEAGIAPGGGIEVHRRQNKFWFGMVLQTADPAAEDYVTAETSGAAKAKIDRLAGYYKDHYIARVLIEEAPLKAGEILSVRFGDKRQGGPGAGVPPLLQPGCYLDLRVDTRGDGTFLPLDPPLIVNVVAGPAAKLVVTAPSTVKAGERARVQVRAEDRNSILCRDYQGTVALAASDPRAQLPKNVTLTPADGGKRVVTVTFRTAGAQTVTARDADAKLAGESNPTQVSAQTPEQRLYWGDLHNHSRESDGTGTLDWNFWYGREVACLDFISMADHLHGMPGEAKLDPERYDRDIDVAEFWRRQQEAAKQWHEPGTFVTLLGYEWSGGSQIGGDHNIYFTDDQHALVYDGDLRKLFDKLAAEPNHGAFIIPHVGGRVGNWEFHDPRVQVAGEIASMHGHFEFFVQDALNRGHRIAIMGASDGHQGTPGYDVWPRHGRYGFQKRTYSVPSALTAVWAPALTRQAIADAFFARRVYATTGARIILEFEADGHPMGSEYETARPPTLRVRVVGAGDIERIDVIRNQVCLKTVKGNGRTAEFTVADESAQPANYYYVRVTQVDGELAWSSPIWVKFGGQPVLEKPKPAWNDEEPLPGPVAWHAGESYTPALTAHLAQRTGAERRDFHDLTQVRIVDHPKGRYALFCGYMGKDNETVHIRWYLGFEDARIVIAPGWRDFGMRRY